MKPTEATNKETTLAVGADNIVIRTTEIAQTGLYIVFHDGQKIFIPNTLATMMNDTAERPNNMSSGYMRVEFTDELIPLLLAHKRR